MLRARAKLHSKKKYANLFNSKIQLKRLWRIARSIIEIEIILDDYKRNITSTHFQLDTFAHCEGSVDRAR